MIEVRQVSSRQRRWQRLHAPTRAWLRNRWNWRAKRRLRADVERWQRLAVPLDRLEFTASDDTRRIAELFERMPGSTVLHLGYGMGESVIVASRLAPARIDPLVSDLAMFSDGEILGNGRSSRSDEAISKRQALAIEIRDVLSSAPKSTDDGSAARP